MLDWKTTDKYQDLCSVKTEVKNIFLSNICNIQVSKRAPIILHWLGQEEIRFVQNLNDQEQEKCKTSKGLFKVTRSRVKPQHTEMILSLQHYKLIGRQNENDEIWKGHLRIKK